MCQNSQRFESQGLTETSACLHCAASHLLPDAAAESVPIGVFTWLNVTICTSRDEISSERRDKTQTTSHQRSRSFETCFVISANTELCVCLGKSSSLASSGFEFLLCRISTCSNCCRSPARVLHFGSAQTFSMTEDASCVSATTAAAAEWIH